MSAADPTFDPAAFDLHVMSTYGRFPIALTRGEGCRVWDSEGRAYLDFAAGIATCTLGHAHPALIDAVSRQIRRLHHVFGVRRRLEPRHSPMLVARPWHRHHLSGGAVRRHRHRDHDQRWLASVGTSAA